MKVGVIISVLVVTIANGMAAQQPSRIREGTATITPSPGSEQVFYFASRRAQIGLTVNIFPQETDSVGALVDAVTPSGPAFKAGIRTGDIVTAFNGRSLVTVARQDGMPSPALALIDMSTRLDVGDTARVEYRRGKNRHTTSVVLEALPQSTTMQLRREPYRTPGPEGRYQPLPGSPGWESDGSIFPGNGPDGGAVFMRSFIADVELAPMNPGLGAYFGTGDGVLVISVPEGSQLNLRPGDVVLEVDGRRVASPNQFFRILSSYDSGESFKFNIMRMKRRVLVIGRLNVR
jgi:hypothetical protein